MCDCGCLTGVDRFFGSSGVVVGVTLDGLAAEGNGDFFGGCVGGIVGGPYPGPAW